MPSHGEVAVLADILRIGNRVQPSGGCLGSAVQCLEDRIADRVRWTESPLGISAAGLQQERSDEQAAPEQTFFHTSASVAQKPHLPMAVG